MSKCNSGREKKSHIALNVNMKVIIFGNFSSYFLLHSKSPPDLVAYKSVYYFIDEDTESQRI